MTYTADIDSGGDLDHNVDGRISKIFNTVG